MNIQIEVETLNNNILNFINLDGIVLPSYNSENKIYMGSECNHGCSGSCDFTCSGGCDGGCR